MFRQGAQWLLPAVEECPSTKKGASSWNPPGLASTVALVSVFPFVLLVGGVRISRPILPLLA